MAYPGHSPGLDDLNKSQVFPPPPDNQQPLLHYAGRTIRRHYPVTRLWGEQVLALLAGAITMALGVLGVAAYFHTGPLSLIFINVDLFTGSLVNGANVGALIAGIATLLSATGRFVISGVARAWLRRRAIRGDGATVKQWRTISAGLSIRDVRRTPLLAGGLVIAFTMAMALNGSALVGAAVPIKIHRITYVDFGSIIPYAGNGGKGMLVNCVDPEVLIPCASQLGVPDMTTAFKDGVGSNHSVYHTVQGEVFSEASFLAAAIPSTIDDSQAPLSYDLVVVQTPVSAFVTKCFGLSSASAAQGQYRYYSDCLHQYISYGNSTAVGNYINGAVCSATDNNTYIVEIAVGGYDYGIGNSLGTFAVECDVSGSEGWGTAQYEFGIGARIVVDSFEGFEPLSTEDMVSVGTAFVSALSAEIGLMGKLGLIGTGVSYAYSKDSGAVDLDALANGVSNAFALGATVGYMTQRGGVENVTFSNVSEQKAKFYTPGYGWGGTTKTLAWSLVCVLIGLVWFVAAAYMVGGGTLYNPTDWFQTINTSAGSTIAQLPGTCTGGNLPSKSVDRNMLWYGEIGPNHVGFAQKPALPLQPRTRYGDIQQVL